MAETPAPVVVNIGNINGQGGATPQQAPQNKPSVAVAYILWLFLGFIGVHHLYMGRGVGVFLIALITGQGFGLWWLLDLFLIPSSCSRIR
jgi:TM2 domain-containing membrane protein YozV